MRSCRCRKPYPRSEQTEYLAAALSQYISNLENSIGAKLFDKIGKRLVLTYVGELYVEKAHKMLELGSQFEAELSDIMDGYKGRLRLGMQEFRSPFITTSIIRAFSSQYPNVEIVLQEGNYTGLCTMLLNNELDLFFCNCIPDNQELESVTVYRDSVLFVVPAGHPLLAKKKYMAGSQYPWIDLKLFENEKFLLQHVGQSIRVSSDEILRNAGVYPKKVFLVRSLATSAQMTAAGMGVSFCNDSLYSLL